MEKIILWLDDKRDPEDQVWKEWRFNNAAIFPFDDNKVIWAKKHHEFVSWIEENGLPDFICFDHDLSDIHINKSTYKENTGYDSAKWLADYCDKNNKKIPQYAIQSSNPVGSENINKYLQNYIKHVESEKHN